MKIRRRLGGYPPEVGWLVGLPMFHRGYFEDHPRTDVSG